MKKIAITCLDDGSIYVFVARTPYEAMTMMLYTLNVKNEDSYAVINKTKSGLPLCSVGDVRDELIYNVDGTGKIIKRTAKIDSYNGEAITTDFVSSTGGLDTGAEVVYVLEAVQEVELSATEIASLMQLQTFNGITNIYNDEGAAMTVKIATNPLLSEYVAPILKGLMTNSAAMSAFLGV